MESIDEPHIKYFDDLVNSLEALGWEDQMKLQVIPSVARHYWNYIKCALAGQTGINANFIATEPYNGGFCSRRWDKP